jgi:hypothetical protein
VEASGETADGIDRLVAEKLGEEHRTVRGGEYGEHSPAYFFSGTKTLERIAY